jgi:hypothetical protein
MHIFASRSSADLVGQLQVHAQEVDHKMMAVLLTKGEEQLVAYLVGPVPQSLLASWKQAGWVATTATEIPDPFPGVHRELVIAATRPDDPRDFKR